MKLISTIIKILILLVFLLLAITNTHTVSFFYLPGQKRQSAADCRAFRCLYYRHRVRYVCSLRPSADPAQRKQPPACRSEKIRPPFRKRPDSGQNRNTGNDFRSHSQSVTPPINKGIPWTTNCGSSYCPSSSSPFSSLWAGLLRASI